MRFRICALLIILVLLAFSVSAIEDNIILLAVTESGEGSIANLNLEIVPGTGRVFIDTYPLTKLDTQISTRFAKEIACELLDNVDCDSYDFIYTIRSNSSIVGGPSAGAAISALTVSLLDNIPLNKSVAITGTINSGGFVGHVSGLKGKIEAASEVGIKKILIPKGERFFIGDNESYDLIEVGDLNNVEVIEILDLEDALLHFTGKTSGSPVEDFQIPKGYIDTMSGLSSELCDRADILRKNLLSVFMLNSDSILSKYENASEILNIGLEYIDNYTNSARSAILDEKYYSAASYCFVANLKLQELLIKFQDDTSMQSFKQVNESIEEVQDELAKKKIETITDLQAFMVVKDRLYDAKQSLSEAKESFFNKEEFESELAYSIERTNSARSWSEFFGKPGKRYVINEFALKDSCFTKISEAEERYQYLQFFLPIPFESIRDNIDIANKHKEDGDYELCLFKAGKAKSQSDSIINSFGVSEESVDSLVDSLFYIAEKNIKRQTKEGVFPILGYSYYEYAADLRDEDIHSSLLFSSYALEMSNLDLYFKEYNNDVKFRLEVDYENIPFILLGIIIGFLIGILFSRHERLRKRKLKRTLRKSHA